MPNRPDDPRARQPAHAKEALRPASDWGANRTDAARVTAHLKHRALAALRHTTWTAILGAPTRDPDPREIQAALIYVLAAAA
jgi:hypothetical protein